MRAMMARLVALFLLLTFAVSPIAAQIYPSARGLAVQAQALAVGRDARIATVVADSRGEPFGFESELLDADTADVSITIELSEAVRVTAKDGGGYVATHLAERHDGDGFDGVCCVNLWQLFLRDDLIAQTSDPAFVVAA